MLNDPPATGLKQHKEEDNQQPGSAPFPIVGIGASAGGLEAFSELFTALPVNTGMAFVLVQHLDPAHESQLTHIMSRLTRMPTEEVRNGVAVERDHVYVIPPNTSITISEGTLRLAPRPRSHVPPLPIDWFFESLAEEQGRLSVGVVLSGSAADGSQGLKAIKSQCGVTFAQDEGTARFKEMPRNAVATGVVDFVLPPAEIARELARISANPFVVSLAGSETEETLPEGDGELKKIFARLQSATGVDFSHYRQTTLRRRIGRRMIVHRSETLGDYLTYLQGHPEEVQALYKDILVCVTHFFRDTEAFSALAQSLTAAVRHKPSKDRFRVWVPGCATGEEVYSLAIILQEIFQQAELRPVLQIFGTDVNEGALAAARAGIYGEGIARDVSPVRLQQFFTEVEGGYQIAKSIRDSCVFAKHDVTRDPPFSRLDLISCRNVLIYLDKALQKSVMPVFHYSLNPAGVLFLGNSETAGDLFEETDRKHKIFTRKIGPARLSASAPLLRQAGESGTPPRIAQAPATLDLRKEADRAIRERYAPDGVIINADLQILQFQGQTGFYLEPAPGEATHHLFRMIRENLQPSLRRVVTTAIQQNTAVEQKGLRIEHEGEEREIDLQVFPIAGPSSTGGLSNGGLSNTDRYYLILFTQRKPVTPSAGSVSLPPSPDANDVGQQNLQFRQELEEAREHLRAITEEYEAALEELQASNEELGSANEELQSTNEELGTAKEELQASNEELATVNEELQNRNGELRALGDDLSNLLSSTTLPILMLDRESRIRRMTPVAETSLKLSVRDLGHPIDETGIPLPKGTIEPLVCSVIETLQPKELELQDMEGRWHVLRVKPYRTAENRIDGAVLVFIDIDRLRRAEIAANAAREFAEVVLQSTQTPFLVVQGDFQIRLANSAFYRSYGFTPSEVEGHSFFEIAGKWNLPDLRASLEGVLETTSEELVFEQESAEGESQTICLRARFVQDGEKLLLMSVEDITVRKRAERLLLEEQARLEREVESSIVELEKTSENLRTEVSEKEQARTALDESRTALAENRQQLRELSGSLINAQDVERRRVARELHDDLSQKVAKLQFDIETLEQQLPAGLTPAKQRLRNVIEQAGALSDDLRRVAHQLHPSALDHLGLTVAIRSYVQEFSRSAAMDVRFAGDEVPRSVPIEVASCLYRIVQEALRNVGKHARDATVEITLVGDGEELELVIRDNGQGFDRELARMKGGLGLVGMQERVRLVGGRYSLRTSPGHGTQITVQVPLKMQDIR